MPLIHSVKNWPYPQKALKTTFSSSDLSQSKTSDQQKSNIEELSCKICSYVSTGKVIKATYTNAAVQLSKSFDCQTSNIVYIVSCKKCKTNTLDKPKTLLNLDSNNIWAMLLLTHRQLELISTALDRTLREQREIHFIEEFNFVYMGMNKKS